MKFIFVCFFLMQLIHKSFKSNKNLISYLFLSLINDRCWRHGLNGLYPDEQRDYGPCILCEAMPTIIRGGSRISGKGVHIYKGEGFALLISSHFS